MYLIDSSLWVDYFRPRGSSSVKQRVRQVIQDDEAIICGPIIVEVLRGAKDEKEYSVLFESLCSLPQIPFEAATFECAAEWAFRLDRKGKVASTINLLIASAAFQRATVLHNDSDYEMIASEFPLLQERVK